MTTTKNETGDIITTSAYLNGRVYATVYLAAPMSTGDLADYIDGIHRDAFTAINAELASRGKHIEAPLVRENFAPDSNGLISTVVYAEWRDDEDDS